MDLTIAKYLDTENVPSVPCEEVLGSGLLKGRLSLHEG